MEAILAIIAIVILVKLFIFLFPFILVVAAIGLVFFVLSWLYHNGWRKTFKSIISLAIVVPICFVVVLEGTPIWKKYQYENSIEGVIESNETMLIDLERSLRRQIGLISDIENTNKYDIQVFLKEIEEEKEKYLIRNLSSATLRVRNNLQLIRERDANLSQLSQIKRATQNGLEETIFMLRQLDGAKGMAKVMTDGKVLASSSQRILEQYGPYEKAIVINPKHRDFKSTEAIWREYVVKSRSSGVTSLMPN